MTKSPAPRTGTRRGMLASLILAVGLAAVPFQGALAGTQGSANVVPPSTPVQPKALSGDRVVTVPGSIDSSGGTDVHRALQSFINRTPNDTTIRFPERGQYRLSEALNISGRHGLTLLGRQSKLLVTGCDVQDSAFIIGDRAPSSDIRIVGFRLRGNNAAGGTSASYRPGCEYQIGVAIYRSQRIEISNTYISRMNGDCVYVGGGGDVWTWSSDILVENSTCRRNGRAGLAITRGGASWRRATRSTSTPIWS